MTRSLRDSLTRAALGLALTAPLTGCAGEGLDGTGETPSAEQEASTIFLANGYGFDANQNRCWFEPGLPAWGGNVCYVPAGKKINYDLLTNNCSAEYVTAMNNAYTYVSNNLSLQGFTVTKTNGTRSTTANVDAIVSCTANTTKTTIPSNALGDTNLFSNPTECSTTAHGNLCKFHDPISSVFTSRINNFLAGVIDTSKRNALIEDQFRHEMLHAAGLGHDLCGGDPVTSLMNRPSSCQNTSNPQSWALANLTKFERDILFSYKP